MADEARVPNDLSVLPWIEQAVGADLLAYMLGADITALPAIIAGDTPVNKQQAQATGILAKVKRAIPAELDDASKTQAVRAWLTQFVQEEGVSVAGLLHRHATGLAETVPATSDDLEAALARLALDTYPAFLLSPDPLLGPVWFLAGRPSIQALSLLIRHPQSAAFAGAVRRDTVLRDVFQHHEEHGGDYGMVYRNTGHGGSLQLVRFPEILLSSAWRHMEGGDRSPEAFAARALQELQFVRGAFVGERRFVTAKVGLMGVLLPDPAARLELSDGVVRAVTEAERTLAPESLKGQLTGANSAGNTVAVNYDGDLLLEWQFPYRVRAVNRPMSATSPAESPQDLLPPPELEETLLRLRFSLMLAVEREHRIQIVPTWRYVDDPLSDGYALGWSDPRQGVGIMPVQLTDAEVASWGEWYGRLNTAHVARIELALSRIVRALAERREPSDVLIDSVIAWENLFGTSEGEPTFRVSTCLAVLLEDALESRAGLKKKLADIYALRSKVVHGSRNLRRSEYPLCQEALEVAIRAIRVLTTRRTDILELTDGAARSTRLLLGAGQSGGSHEQPA